MRDIGKRRISADGFQILESYDFDDIAVLHADEYKERLQQLLAEQNRLCELKPYRGDIDKKETIAQTIANDFYRRIPSEVRNEYEGTIKMQYTHCLSALDAWQVKWSESASTQFEIIRTKN